MVKEYHYGLQEEDFRSWFHWNVVNNSHKGKKYFGYTLSCAVAAIVVYQAYMQAGLNFQRLLPSILLAAGVMFVMLYTASDKAVERALWKRSGLQRMKKNNAFPKVHLTVDEKRITIETEAQPSVGLDATKLLISYSQLDGVEAIDRLLLIRQPKQIQFVARSVFTSQEEEDEFIRYIEERIADAKEHPEEYTPELTPEEIEAAEMEKAEREENAAALAANPAAHDEDSKVDETDIRRVDTSNMGTIGKLAHMVAADVNDEADDAEVHEDAPEAAEAVDAVSDAEESAEAAPKAA